MGLRGRSRRTSLELEIVGRNRAQNVKANCDNAPRRRSPCWKEHDSTQVQTLLASFGHPFKKMISCINDGGLRYTSMAPMTWDRLLRANLKEEEGQERQEVEKEKGED